MHGQNGRRLLAQPLATRFHEVMCRSPQRNYH
nr:MAG TPA: hypothetical protein [Caudoviricetes sp.]